MTQSMIEYENSVSWLNVHNSILEILQQSELIQKGVESQKLKITSAFYDVEIGVVRFER
jgi:carbonic anhydrase